LIIAEIRGRMVTSDFKLNFIKYSISNCRCKRHFANPRRGSARHLWKGKRERRYISNICISSWTATGVIWKPWMRLKHPQHNRRSCLKSYHLLQIKQTTSPNLHSDWSVHKIEDPTLTADRIRDDRYSDKPKRSKRIQTPQSSSQSRMEIQTLQAAKESI